MGIVDTDIASPGIHVLFGMEMMERALNDYLWGRCAIEECAHDVGESIGLNKGRTGVSEETILSIAISDQSIIILRPDQQDFQGEEIRQTKRCLDV